MFAKPFQGFLLIFFLLIFFQSKAQVISGKVTHAQTKDPLPFANVFINNTTIGAISNEQGVFRITGDFPTTIELVASFVGYKTVSQKIEFNGKLNLEVDFQLEPQESVLTEVETRSRRDKKWERQLDKFEKVFLAVPDDPILKEIEIENPWVLNFETVKENKGPNYIKASADQPLIVKNEALGYDIEYYLQDYRFYKDRSLYYGLAFFSEKESSDSTVQNAWEEHKESSYLGSTRHFFRSLLVRKAESEGFQLYKKNPFYYNKFRSNSLEVETGKSVDLISQDSIRRIPLRNGYFRIILPYEMEIHYLQKAWRNEFYVDFYHPVSWISAPLGYFDVDRNGIPVDPKQVVLSGYMGRQRMGRFLPYDFQPAEGFESLLAEVDSLERQKNQANNLREKPWITTNKSYYYPGETVWFHAKMLYHNPMMVDTLSKVLYLEIFNSDYEIVQSEIFPIENGSVSSGFVLSDSLKANNYFIRSYTNWMRNFPAKDITLLPFPILDRGEVILSEPIPEVDFFGDLTISVSYQMIQETGNQVEVSVKILDETEEPTDAEFSISLTDPLLVGVISGRQNLESGLEWLDDKTIPSNSGMEDYPIEFGISVEGRFERTKKRQPYINPITIVQGNLEDYGIVKTDSTGYFRATGLNFTDSSSIYLAALDEKNNPYGLVSLIENKPPTFKGSYPTYHYQTKPSTGQMMRFDMEGDYIELEEFVKEDKVIQRLEDTNYGYGEPDREVIREDLDNWFGQPISMVIGMKFGNGKLGNYNYGVRVGEPLVIIDGQRYFYSEGETANDVLSRYLTNEVESISIYTTNTQIFGLSGFAGVIMFNTKKGERNGQVSESQFNSEGFQQFRMRGFSKPMNFLEAKESRTSFQSPTIYWNPEANTSSENGEFHFVFDRSEGVNTYNLFIEGITGQGLPFTKIILINLDK